MKLIKQKTKSDCGVACLAMLAGISWGQARNALFNRGRKKDFSTTTDTMRAALRRFGVITSKRIHRCTNPRRLKRDALLNTNVLANGDSHWAVWDAKSRKVLDPYYKRTRFHSCLVVLRREHRTSN
jgi:ABC-type bacteriocin/lantibiotic exporter with double-glycine peptidase domain